MGRMAASLTSLTAGGGCAAKYSAARLEELLKGFVPVEAENLLVGLVARRRRGGLQARRRARDRLHGRLLPAARRRSGDLRPHRRDERVERRLRDGRHAAPRALDRRVPGGAADGGARRRSSPPRRSRCAAAGAILAGGHTIRDAEPKYGLAVVGTVHPQGIWPKSGARAGDALFLTKPLGTGLVLAGHGSSSCRAPTSTRRSSG